MKVFRGNMVHSWVKELNKLIKNVETWDVRVHADKRMLEKSLKFDLMDIIANGSIVEWHNNNGTERVVLEVNNGKSRDSVVLDLDTEEIITAFSRDNNNLGRDNRKYFLGG